MEIALVGEPFERRVGGIEFHTSTLASALRATGHAVTIVMPEEIHSLRDGRFDWLLLEGVKRPSLVRLSLSGSVRHTRRAIFTHGSYFEFIHRRTLQSRGYAVYTPRWFLKRACDLAFVNRVVNSFDAIFVLSEGERRDLTKFGFDPDRLTVLPNFVDARGLEPDPDAPRFGQFSPYVCAISRVDRRKNFGAVIRAIKGSKIGFVLAGPDGGDLSRLLDIARTENAENFHYLGVITESEKWSLLHNSMGTVLPSIFEGAPFTALESLSVGRPVVCSDLSYLAGYPGVETCRSDPVSIRQAIDRIGRSTPTASGVMTSQEIVPMLMAALRAHESGSAN